MSNTSGKQTPMTTNEKLNKEDNAKDLDQKLYRGTIESLLYIMASRPDIMHSVCLCARYQSQSKETHLKSVKTYIKICKQHVRL